jgi:hypothetical protein
VLFNLHNTPVGAVQGQQVLNRNDGSWPGSTGAFAWDASGVLAFVKGATPQGGLALPKTAPLRAKLAPTPAPLRPLLVHLEPPPRSWRWSERTLSDVLDAALDV